MYDKRITLSATFAVQYDNQKVLDACAALQV